MPAPTSTNLAFYGSCPVRSAPQNIVLDRAGDGAAWKAPTFIQHAFTRYPIIGGSTNFSLPHFLWCQVRGPGAVKLRWQEREVKQPFVAPSSLRCCRSQRFADSDGVALPACDFEV